MLYKFSHFAANREVPTFAWFAAAKEMWAQGGLGASTRGMAVSVIGSALHNGFLFMGYHSVRSWWPSKDHKLMSVTAAGVAAG